MRFAFYLVLTLFALGQPSESAQTPKTAATVGFSKDVLPIVRTACLGCHSGPTPSGGYSVASFEDLVRPGRKGAMVVPGKPKDSRLYQLVSGLAQPRMPPGAGLKPADVDVFRRWIETGAKSDVVAKAANPALKPVRTGIASAGPRPEFVVSGNLRQRPAPVNALAWSSDSSLVAVGTYQRVLVFETATWSVRHEWSGHADAVRALAFTKDDKQLLAAGGLPGAFGEIRVWDVASSKEVRSFGDHTDVVQGIAIATDNQRVVSVSADKMVKIWEINTGKILQTLRDHSDAVLAVAFHPGGKYMVTCGADKSAKVWDFETGKRLHSIGVGDDPVVSVAFSPNGSQFHTGTEQRIRRWNFNPDGSGHAGDSGHGGMVWGVDARAERIATVSADKQVRIFDLNSNQVAAFGDANEWLYSVALDKSGKRVVAGTWDGRVLVWDIDTKKLLRSVDTTPKAIVK